MVLGEIRFDWGEQLALSVFGERSAGDLDVPGEVNRIRSRLPPVEQMLRGLRWR